MESNNLNELSGAELLKMFLNSPNEFMQNEGGYYLMNKYLEGMPIITIVPFLQNRDPRVRLEAIGIVSELGEDNCYALLDNIIPLLNDNNGIKYFALEGIVLGSINDRIDELKKVLVEFNSDDEYIRNSALFLISNCGKTKIHSFIDSQSNKEKSDHLEGLKLLIDDNISDEKIFELLISDNPTLQLYAGILVKKCHHRYPKLYKFGIKHSSHEVQSFLRYIKSLLK